MVLFDEIEKAHPDVFNLFLQILEDGQLTDSHGRTVSFKNTIIIMTSNLGSDLLLECGGDVEKTRPEIDKLLHAQFRPEFLNRIDGILLFKPLELDQIESIFDIQIGLLRERLNKQGVALEVTKEARTLLAKRGYDPRFGARPLKRVLVNDLETPLSRMLISGELHEGMTLTVGAKKDGELKFTCAEKG